MSKALLDCGHPRGCLTEAEDGPTSTRHCRWCMEIGRLVAQIPLWFPAREELPGEDESVLVTDGGSIGEAIMCEGDKWRLFTVNGLSAPAKRDEITHWMPMPELPGDEV